MTDAAEIAVLPGGQPGQSVADTVLERARAGQISLIRFLYADHGGIIRGKAMHVSGLEARMASGIGHTVAMMAMNMLDHLRWSGAAGCWVRCAQDLHPHDRGPKGTTTAPGSTKRVYQASP
jgi:glutamine synthetase-like protein